MRVLYQLMTVLAFFGNLSIAGIFMDAAEKKRIDDYENVLRSRDPQALKPYFEELLDIINDFNAVPPEFRRHINQVFGKKFAKGYSPELLLHLGELTAIAISSDHSSKYHSSLYAGIDQLREHYLGVAAFRAESIATFKLIVAQVSPLIFFDEQSLFSIEAYFYALSRGIALLGLPFSPSDDVHGGLFESPAEVFEHDTYHLGNQFFIASSNNDLYKIDIERINNFNRRYLIALADFTLRSVRDAVHEHEKKRILITMFILLHESRFTPISYNGPSARKLRIDPQVVEPQGEINIDALLLEAISAAKRYFSAKLLRDDLNNCHDYYRNLFEQKLATMANKSAELEILCSAPKTFAVSENDKEDRAVINVRATPKVGLKPTSILVRIDIDGENRFHYTKKFSADLAHFAYVLSGNDMIFYGPDKSLDYDSTLVRQIILEAFDEINVFPFD